MESPCPRDPVDLYPGQRIHVGMALKGAFALAQTIEHLTREVAALSQGRVKRWSSMTLAEHEAVTVLPLGVLRVVPHDLEVQGGYDVCCGQGAAGVSRASSGGHANDVTAQASRFALQL